MSIQAKHLSECPGQTQCAETLTCCQAAESLAGDCRLGFAERFRMVEADCRFGLNCTRGCHEARPASFGFAGDAAILGGVVGQIQAASNERAIKEPSA